MHKKIHVKTKNKICAAVLVFVLAGSLTAGACAVPNVYAKTEAEKKRDAYKKKLREKNGDIANIKDSQSDVKDSISVAAAKMKTLLSKQEQLKSDIKDKQNEVEQANKKLEEAKEEEQKQYDAMKLRIQYLYENSTDNSIWSAILESNGLSDMLNRIEYATDLYKSDRELMTSYQNAVKKVEDWTMQLADEMDSLLALQDKYQTQQGELKTLMAMHILESVPHGIPRHLRVWDSRCLIRISRREMSWYIRDMWQFTLETEISWRRSQQEPELQTAVR